MGGKRRQLEMTVTTIQQRWGPRALHKLEYSAITPNVPHISTGFPALDETLSIGGLARGRISELLGPPTSGKTTLALKFLVQAQVGGGSVAYIDHARFFDPDYAYRCGLDLSRLLIAAPYDLAEALAICEALAGSGDLAALVFDGLDLLWEDAQAAPLIVASLARLGPLLARSGTVVLFLHPPLRSGSPGLSALAHHATARLAVERESWLRHYGDVCGYTARVEIAKNRFGPAGRTVTITIDFRNTVRGDSL